MRVHFELRPVSLTVVALANDLDGKLAFVRIIFRIVGVLRKQKRDTRQSQSFVEARKSSVKCLKQR
jgi:hypothetical protein